MQATALIACRLYVDRWCGLGCFLLEFLDLLNGADTRRFLETLAPGLALRLDCFLLGLRVRNHRPRFGDETDVLDMSTFIYIKRSFGKRFHRDHLNEHRRTLDAYLVDCLLHVPRNSRRLEAVE